jgi:hypothetical protein
MNKIFSTRIDESIIQLINILARKLKTSKKNVVETAIQSYAKEIGVKENIDVFELTCGTWKRSDSPDKLRRHMRKAFNESIRRHDK